MVSETYMYVPCSYYKLQEVDLEIQYEDGNHDDDQDDQTLKKYGTGNRMSTLL
jgi:hypothetical protein